MEIREEITQKLYFALKDAISEFQKKECEDLNNFEVIEILTELITEANRNNV